MLAAAPATAQDRTSPIRAVIAEVRAEEIKAKPLIARMEQLVTQNEERKKAYDAADRERKALQPRLDRYEADLGKYETALADYSKLVEGYNKRCSGTLPNDQFRACLGEKGELAGRKIELDQAKAKLDADRTAVEADLKAKTAQLAAIATEMTGNLRAWEAAQKDYIAIYQRIETHRKKLAELCIVADQAKDPFAVRVCVSLGWDGERKDFLALTDLPAPSK